MRGLRTTILILISIFLVTCASGTKSNSGSTGFDIIPSVPDKENNIPVQPTSGKTATEYFHDEAIFAGWNLGNTLDAHINGESRETAWGNPRVNQDLMNGVKNAGFDIVRIPITWMGHIGAAPDHHIEELYLRRIAEVVNMANQAGLKAIINLHHDGADTNNWLSIVTARRNKESYQQVTLQFVRVWKQIALYFKNYGDWLMFESFNEIHDGSWGNTAGALIVDQLNIINEWNQLFTNAVRQSGGNNANRYLVIPGYCTNMRHTLGPYFKLPEDSSPGRQILTFHYYDPYQFGIQGTQANWGTEADKKKTDDDFKPFKERFVDQNVPVIIGECGAVLQLYPNNPDREETARQSRREYMQHIYGTAKKYGIVPIYWDNGGITGTGEKFGLFARRTGAFNSPESELLVKAMINAVR
jgi:endoglucanase